jgi:hypothetical protein
MIGWAAWLIGLAVLAAGAILGMGTIGILPPDPYSGFVGIGLGALCLLGAFWATAA